MNFKNELVKRMVYMMRYDYRFFKRMLSLLLIIVIGIPLAACSPQDGPYHKISAGDAKKMMDTGEPFILVDVRTDMEFAEGHIEGAILIPNETIKDQQPALLPDKDATILIYCRSGNRSKQASDKLIEMGYTNIYDFGGIIDWTYGLVK